MGNPALDKVLADLRLKQGAEMRIRDEVWARYFDEQELREIVNPGTVALPWVPRVEEVIKRLERTMELKNGTAMMGSIRKVISDLQTLLD